MKEIIYNDGFDAVATKTIEEIAADFGLLPETARLLYSRGYTEREKVARFLNAGKHNFLDPFKLSGMSEAVERITEARDSGEAVLVYGDYDADGVSAAAILCNALIEFGIETYAVVPERENGYGLCTDIVAKYCEEYFTGLVITVDCGISDREKVEYIQNEIGAEVIVTDHHEIPDIIPDAVVINPHLPNQDYGFESLCGAGVAFKLAYALLGDGADKFLDLAALATVADSMPLVGENRDIVCEGLKLCASAEPRLAIKTLLATANAREINAQTLAYTIAPRINAAGRMGDAASALKLFLSDDEEEINALSIKLGSYNLERQAECDSLYRAAKEKLNAEGAYRNVIMLYDENWQTGFVGIVAARLVEEYSRPVIMFAGTGSFLKGSARSLPTINIFEAIAANKEWLIEFGGHSQAAGVAVDKANFEAFYNAVDNYLGANCTVSDYAPRIYAECLMKDKFSMRFAEELGLLEPYGVGNRKPLFVAEVESVAAAPLKALSSHLSFTSDTLEMLYFGGIKNSEVLSLPMRKLIVFEPNISVYNKRKSLKGFVKDCLPVYTNDVALEDYIFEREVLSLAGGRNLSRAEGVGENEISSLITEALKQNYGTLFAVSDPATLKNYPMLDSLSKSVFRPSENNLLNSVTVCPTALTEGFRWVIYLDKPVAVTATGRKTYYNNERVGATLFDGITLERTAFTEVFVILRRLSGKKFVNAVDFYSANRVQYNKRQFIFCLRVFTDLGIFKVKDGFITQDASVKTDLHNSRIYTETEEILSNV